MFKFMDCSTEASWEEHAVTVDVEEGVSFACTNEDNSSMEVQGLNESIEVQALNESSAH